jgi:hypothetical protein
MFRKILIGLAVMVVGLVLVVTSRPSTFHIERSITIGAPAESAFVRVNDFHAWAAWSPWEKMDPQMKRTFEGPPAGPGASYAWAGNDKVGEGRMTMLESAKPSRVSIKLEFFKPWTATNAATFSFTPVHDGTKVIWAMDGHNNFGAKASSLFMNIDKLVGADFESGLVALKAEAEQGSNAHAERPNAVD